MLKQILWESSFLHICEIWMLTTTFDSLCIHTDPFSNFQGMEHISVISSRPQMLIIVIWYKEIILPDALYLADPKNNWH